MVIVGCATFLNLLLYLIVQSQNFYRRMVRDRYAPGLLEIDRMRDGSWEGVMELYNEEVAEGDMGAGGGEG
jgi:hypothetical protein